MHLLPTPEEVVRVLRETGALRDGHFEYPSGLHSNEYLQVPLAMRYYQHARTFERGAEPLLRANPEIRAMIPELSIVAPATGGPAGGLRRLRSACAPNRFTGRSETKTKPALALPPVPGAASRANRWCWWTIFCARATS